MIKLAERLNLPENLINELGKLDEGEISSLAEKCFEKGFSALKRKYTL